ncbi:MAG: hypothetical protein AB8B91_18405 [Rubripirellula sp.]
MTQLLLFNSTNNSTTAAPLADVTPVVTPAAPAENLAERLEHESGLHHMGDLARLVLLRYDLVAKRRAEMAARKAK